MDYLKPTKVKVMNKKYANLIGLFHFFEPFQILIKLIA